MTRESAGPVVGERPPREWCNQSGRANPRQFADPPPKGKQNGSDPTPWLSTALGESTRFGGNSLPFEHLIEKPDDAIGVVARAPLDGRARVGVDLAGHHVRELVTPLHFIPQRHEVVLDEFEDRSLMELGIAKESKQEFHRAI